MTQPVAISQLLLSDIQVLAKKAQENGRHRKMVATVAQGSHSGRHRGYAWTNSRNSHLLRLIWLLPPPKVKIFSNRDHQFSVVCAAGNRCLV